MICQKKRKTMERGFGDSKKKRRKNKESKIIK